MKRKYLFLVPLLGLFLGLGLVSCETDTDKFGARLIDESELDHVPVGFLRFKWQGVIGNQQTLTMWHEDFVEGVDEMEEPYFFRLGFGINYAPVNEDYYVFQTEDWIPMVSEKYNWNITSYYQNGDVEVSDTRTFVPNPPQP